MRVMDLGDEKAPPRALRRGDSATLSIERLTQDGRGVTRVDGKVVFVADALPGETVTATIVRKRRRHDEARTDEIQQSSPQRVTTRCQWFGACGGCSLQHLAASSQLEVKQQWLLDALQRIGGVTPE
ncbi:MAG: 23S rRNA (uracil(1939)-C(5))-methyltransferase, partial [Gammaproteobacteria bacterium]|nr:23S rRNA (uracil(1939)-C(5))-methyltransferase [Gammaproteobacteria bacterium]